MVVEISCCNLSHLLCVLRWPARLCGRLACEIRYIFIEVSNTYINHTGSPRDPREFWQELVLAHVAQYTFVSFSQANVSYPADRPYT
ncbi:hypothetical protein ACN42_g10601 [Penicillium freii]|uniref:Uncharacterized protein n=1 Tax=Penicillium freii TaxID=48697 RepID=A0A101M9S3_PENFR|nr:hypothetical protein ACN42_g10601 [Penicillium freii]